MRFTKQITLEAAEHGNSVIVGRGPQHQLRDRDDVLRILLFASREATIQRLHQGGY
jgi:Cytidylate kinase-like family